MRGGKLLLLTTTGRKSGRPRTAPLMYVPHGDALLVIASNGGLDSHFPGYGEYQARTERQIPLVILTPTSD